MARTMDLMTLVTQPESYRDEEWEKAFFQAVIEGRLKVTQSQAMAGPDGWPYLFAETNYDATEPTVRIIEWLSEKGIGLVVNPNKSMPDYVFTYGMIWNFRERGEFISTNPTLETGMVEFKEGQKIHAGPPSDQFLPPYVREILKQFFQDQGIENPKVLVLSQDMKNYDLCFSLESMGMPDQGDHQDIAEAISWFLPQHYSIMLLSEKDLPNFCELQP